MVYLGSLGEVWLKWKLNDLSVAPLEQVINSGEMPRVHAENTRHHYCGWDPDVECSPSLCEPWK